MSGRNGKRKTREQLSKKLEPKLGYYYIVTDTKETEKKYFNGLRNSIPQNLSRNLVIKVCKAKTSELVDEAINLSATHYQYCEPWIVFDRDKVNNFDEIILTAKKRGVKAGWSNPCIEIWFGAYFGEMPTSSGSVACCRSFEKQYYDKTGIEYKKSDTDIYSKLCKYGDEKKAIDIAERKYAQHKRDCKSKPSQMNPCTTVHTLVKEIKEKLEKEQK